MCRRIASILSPAAPHMSILLCVCVPHSLAPAPSKRFPITCSGSTMTCLHPRHLARRSRCCCLQRHLAPATATSCAYAAKATAHPRCCCCSTAGAVACSSCGSTRTSPRSFLFPQTSTCSSRPVSTAPATSRATCTADWHLCSTLAAYSTGCTSRPSLCLFCHTLSRYALLGQAPAPAAARVIEQQLSQQHRDVAPFLYAAALPPSALAA